LKHQPKVGVIARSDEPIEGNAAISDPVKAVNSYSRMDAACHAVALAKAGVRREDLNLELQLLRCTISVTLLTIRTLGFKYLFES